MASIVLKVKIIKNGESENVFNREETSTYQENRQYKAFKERIDTDSGQSASNIIKESKSKWRLNI